MSFFQEKILLAQGEKIVKEEDVRYEGGLTYHAKRVNGLLSITTNRILFVARKGELGRDEKVIVNFPLDRLFTGESRARLITTLLDRAGAPLIASIFGDFVTISFEDWFGVLQKPRFKSKNAIQWSDVINSIMAAKSPDSSPISLRRKELDKFRAFVTFLSSEKAISPLELDPVSRVISIRGSQIFIGDNWTVTAQSGIKQSVEEWINFFVARNRW